MKGRPAHVAFAFLFVAGLTTATAAPVTEAPPVPEGPRCCDYFTPPRPLRGLPTPLLWTRVGGVATVIVLTVCIGASLYSERRRRRAWAAFVVDVIDDDA